MAQAQKTSDLLDNYESLIEHRNRVAIENAKLLDELELLDKKLVDARGQLRLALNPESPPSSSEATPTKPAAPKKNGTARTVQVSDFTAKLANVDPRVQRSLGKVFRLLQRKQATECTPTWLAESLDISYEAARQRLARGVTLGIFKKISPSTYAVAF